MNKYLRDNSLICDLMFNDENWKEIIESKGIHVNIDNCYAIFNYDMGCDFSDPYVCEARGIIIDTVGCHVVCRGFNKFFNVQEQFAAKIDWDTAIVQEKIDGSIIKIWWSDRLGRWIYSTNGVIFSENAMCNQMYSFYDVIMKCSNIKNIMGFLSNRVCRLCTWIFELVSPYNQVVIKYDKPILYHIGCRANFNGNEYDKSQYFSPIPRRYKLKTLDDCLAAVKELNKSEKVNHEGFVVVDGYFNRVKIKSPEYLAVHRLIGNHCYNKEKMIDLMLLKRKTEIDEFDNDLFRLYKKYYDYQIEFVRFQLSNFLDYCMKLDEEFEHDRKVIALQIKDNKFSCYGFEMLFKGKSKDEILDGLDFRQYAKYIKNFSDYLKEVMQ